MDAPGFYNSPEFFQNDITEEYIKARVDHFWRNDDGSCTSKIILECAIDAIEQDEWPCFWASFTSVVDKTPILKAKIDQYLRYYIEASEDDWE